MTFHIGAKPGEIAETVLLPGDPYRARWAAQKFLENPVLVNEVRGMLGFTGTYKGNRVTIHGSGMGMPSLSIYANELIKEFGAKTLIRIGSAGALQPHVHVRDVVLAHYHDDLGLHEIAQKLSVSESAVRSRLHRARVRLKAILNATPHAWDT